MIEQGNTGKIRMIDWGIADFYTPGQYKSPRAGTKRYKAPELLMGYGYYDYSIDLFSTGVWFAGMIFQTSHFWGGKDDLDQQMKIAQTLGS